MSSAASRALSWFRHARITLAFLLANSLAVSLPIPREYKLPIRQTGAPHVVSIFLRFTHSAGLRRTRLATGEILPQVDTNVRKHTRNSSRNGAETS
uniref:Putative secreted protein n=1 Tax=Ixodes ricinus TaxID=34613 RepID=A0A6B0U412_IXORI